jgi:hypothetical protein
VEAPADFSLRVKSRARKAGLFRSRLYKAVGRTLVPFEAVMAVLLACMGGIVVIMLMFYSQLEPDPIEPPPLVLMVDTQQEVNLLAAAAWEAGGDAYVMGRSVPPGSLLGSCVEMELALDPERFGEFVTRLGPPARQAGWDRMPAPVRSDGRVHVIVQLREPVVEDGGLPAQGDPASSADPRRIPPDRPSPRPGDKER